MSQKVLKLKTKNPAKRIFSTLFSLLIIGVSGLLIYNSTLEWMKVNESNKQLSTVKQELSGLIMEQDNLTEVQAKLSDPGYAQNYARGKHLMSKSEEQVFVLPKAEE